MKTTGMVRRIDRLGRIVLPIELRRYCGIREKESLEILVDGDHIILRPYPAADSFRDADGKAALK